MELTLHKPGDHHFVRSVSPEGVNVNDTLYAKSLILTAETLLPDWPVNAMEDLGESTLQPILDLEPEVVILGTGETQDFLPPTLAMKFYEQGIGIEAMTTEAACRTFNVLVSEERKVAAALIVRSLNTT